MGVSGATSGGVVPLLGLLLSISCGGPTTPSKPASAAAPPDVPAWVHGDDNCNGSIDEGCGLTSGLLQFAAAWVEPAVDVDLEVTDPDGQLVELRRVSESGLFKERDCPGRDGECRGVNLENVVLQSNESMRRGTYVVRVRLENLADVEDPVRVHLSARLGPKQFAVVFDLQDEKEERQFELTL